MLAKVFKDFYTPVYMVFNKIKAVILDRDGVINKKAKKQEYILSKNQFVILPGVKKAIAKLNSKGILVFIVTNQQAIGKKLLTKEEFHKMNSYLNIEISSFGGKIKKIYCCPHLKEENCPYRKPSSGMIFELMKEFNLKPNEIVFIGDSFSDYQSSASAGCKFVFIKSESDELEENINKFKEINANPIAFDTLYQAVRCISN